MADELNENGLSLDNYATLLGNIQSAMNLIYAPDGNNINFDSETPDGQFTNILAQIGTDIRDLAQEIYNSFNPDNCTGVVQDQRYALNYITRKAGTFTIQDIDITCNKTVALQGLDSEYNNPSAAAYTVSDDGGNLWYLIDSIEIPAGTTRLPFRSQNIGLSQPTIGTINTQVTKVLGVTNVTNAVAPTSLGEAQESDGEFRIRRSRSTAIKGQNNYDIMTGQLLELEGVKDAKVFVNNTGDENVTVTGDADQGVPPYSIWVIVEGGAADDIADIIYHNSAGLPTFGYENQNVSPVIEPTEVTTITVSQQPYTVYFNRNHGVNIYIKFDLKIAEPNVSINIDNIKTDMASNITFKLNQNAETSYITEVAAQSLLKYNANIYALNVQISLGATENTTVTGTGIEAAATDVNIFKSAVNYVDGTYTFVYTNNEWQLNSAAVDLADYGIEITGTPVANDEISVVYAGNWTDFLPATSWLNKFVVAANNIAIIQV